MREEGRRGEGEKGKTGKARKGGEVRKGSEEEFTCWIQIRCACVVPWSE